LKHVPVTNPILLLESYHPAEFSSNPDETYLKLIRVLLESYTGRVC